MRQQMPLLLNNKALRDIDCETHATKDVLVFGIIDPMRNHILRGTWYDIM